MPVRGDGGVATGVIVEGQVAGGNRDIERGKFGDAEIASAEELAALPPTGVGAAKRAFAAPLLADLTRLDGLPSA